MFGNKKLKQQQQAEYLANFLKEVEEGENKKKKVSKNKSDELFVELDVVYTTLKEKYREATLSDAISLYNSQNTNKLIQDYIDLTCTINDTYVF